MEPYYQDDAVTIWHANALALPIPDESVDLIVTSPPYFGLRSYQDGGEHYDGQIGSEATPAEFVDALIAATREMVRVLKPSGSIWVNLGDKYAQNTERSRNAVGGGLDGGKPVRIDGTVTLGSLRNGVPTKSLIGVPWRYALRCIDDLGLILRAEVIWSKPNGLPESVTDRVRRSHETWFHFTRQPRYYSAVDEIRGGYAPDASARRALYRAPSASRYAEGNRKDAARKTSMGVGIDENPLGKLPGSVWEIPTQPLQVPAELGIDHFAAFPMELPRRIIRGWSPSGICTACGEGRRPVTSGKAEPNPALSLATRARTNTASASTAAACTSTLGRAASEATRMVVGEACACPDTSAPTRPAVVLDPFGGTGTVALVARVLGRQCWHVDLSRDYCQLARWRVTHPGELARAMQVEKPEPVAENQSSLLDLLA